MADWLSKHPIASYEPRLHKGRWIPGLEIFSEEAFPDGWVQRFVLHDGTSENRYPVERSSSVRQDLTDSEFLVSQWKSLHGEREDDND